MMAKFTLRLILLLALLLIPAMAGVAAVIDDLEMAE